MYHEIPDLEQAAELAEWWRQAFESPSAACRASSLTAAT